MKSYAPKRSHLLLFMLLPLIVQATGSHIPGYLIAQNNDTVNVQLVLSKALLGQIKEAKLNNSVEIMDSSGATKQLSPDEIKGFGFTYKGKPYVYLSKPVDKQGKKLFLQPLISGPKATLFYYRIMYYRSSEDHFTFEKQDGTYLFVSAFSGLDIFRNKLKSFFSDNKEVLDLINGSFYSRGKIEQDVAKVVAQANNDQKPYEDLQQRITSK